MKLKIILISVVFYSMSAYANNTKISIGTALYLQSFDIFANMVNLKKAETSALEEALNKITADCGSPFFVRIFRKPEFQLNSYEMSVSIEYSCLDE